MFFPLGRMNIANIAYVTTYDATDLHAWSGLGYYILQSLKGSGFQIQTIGNLHSQKVLQGKLKKFYYAKILSQTYLIEREPALIKAYAEQVKERLSSVHCDVIFSPGTLPIAHLKTEKPVVFWSDATFSGVVDFYPSFMNLCPETINKGHQIEQLALSNCRIAIYSSDWAAKTAMQNYAVDPRKVHVVPFGANLNGTRSPADIQNLLKNKPFDVCKLLFFGVDWYRKGGDIALTIAERLMQRGRRVELHVVGCHPPGQWPAFVINHGFISKKTLSGRVHLAQLMSTSHFLILPARAECYGIVFAEASSYGLPSIATAVGGIPTVIQDGRNGQTFPLETHPDVYCDYIENLMSSEQHYRALALSCFQDFTERLNWQTAGQRVNDLIQQFCS
jgi:glycosyltransferase involved in cell wall biosynthesis